mmetsp:Transcript_3784/g.7532  ORF Transcript_3784/g.7532 Transcript_3784/m.7532 type:complete len:113 (-) Transcript_3784:395-733(-)|eukprot:scaffold2103_cov185-Amphora_coffeaeformis.AAC.8
MGSKASVPAASSADTKAFIESEVNSHQVVIFSKTYCGFCTRTKNLFSNGELSNDVKIHELDRMPDGSSIQQTLASMTGQQTVPSVFIKGQHLGGNDDTQTAFRTGKLKAMLQ